MITEDLYSQLPEDNTESQMKTLAEHFRSGGKTTRAHAFEHFGIANLTARISDVRLKLHMPVKTEMVRSANKKRYAVYSMQ